MTTKSEYRGFDIVFDATTSKWVATLSHNPNTIYRDTSLYGVQMDIDEYWSYDDSNHHNDEGYPTDEHDDYF